MTPEPAYAALCEKITASKAVIEANNARADEIRAASNIEEPVAEAEAPVEAPAEEPAAPQDDQPQE